MMSKMLDVTGFILKIYSPFKERNVVKATIWITLFSLFISCESQKIGIPEKFGATQLLVVTTKADTSTTGTLLFYKFNAETGKWSKIFDTIPVNIGRGGLAWGKGLQHLNAENSSRKQEGDGKSPAGIFYLRAAFGYAPSASFFNSHYPYITVDSTSVCIDDSKSSYYNEIINVNEINKMKNWRSEEQMKRGDSLYEWGINIGYNDDPVVNNSGSCVFFHIWAGPNVPTSGCTSMSKPNLIKLLKELNSKSKPVVIQGTIMQLSEMGEIYQLP